MGRETQSILLGLLGGVLITITATGRYTSYVKPGFGPLLMISGILLVVLAVVTLVQTIRSEVKAGKTGNMVAAGTSGVHEHGTHPTHAQADGGVDSHGHDHDGSRAPWLILVPVLVLLLVAPAALGADSVARSSGSQALAGLDVAAPAAATGDVPGDGGYRPNDGSGNSSVGTATSGTGAGSGTGGRSMQFPPLPAGTDPTVSMKELVLRALYDGEGSVAKTPVTVVGFIAGAGEGQTGGYTLARVVISCCAADANPMRVHVAGDAPLPENTWVSAVVTAMPGSATIENEYVPTVEVHTIEQIAQPADPYEH